MKDTDGLVYLDTNVYSLLAREPSLRSRLTRLLIDTGQPGGLRLSRLAKQIFSNCSGRLEFTLRCVKSCSFIP
jgi:hypothetical protein